MRSQRFGIEIEMTGITRCKAAQAIAGVLGSSVTSVGGGYDTYTVRDDQNRTWKVMRDGSIRCRSSNNEPASDRHSVEIVSPICRYDDIELIQRIVRAVKAKGAIVNSSCGIHVHVDASSHNPQTLRNIVNIMASKEDLLYKALDIEVDRQRYCKKTDVRFLDALNAQKPRTMQEVERLWYDGPSRSGYHYDSSRYRGLNLHSVFSKGTVEFRLFNSTLHAGRVRTYIQLCLAISHQALIQKGASRTRTTSSNEKYTFRTWLLRLGMIGKEFKTARMFMLEKLEGNIAWKDPAQAEAQRKRLAARHDEQGISPEELTEGEDTEAECEEIDESTDMHVAM